MSILPTSELVMRYVQAKGPGPNAFVVFTQRVATE